jgi:hypothetical protein
MMSTALTANTSVFVAKSPRHDNPNCPVRNDFEPEDLQPAVADVRSMVRKFRQRTYPWYYELGEVVRQHYEQVEEDRAAMGRSMYGQRFFNRIGIELDLPSIDGQVLYGCFKLVKAYTREQYDELCQHDAITPTHAMMLARVQGKERKELEEKVKAERLTTKGLFKAEQEMFGPRRDPGGGRKPKVPKTVNEALVHLTSQAEQFVKLNGTSWFGDAFDLTSEIGDIPANKLDDNFQAKVEDALRQCEILAETAAKNTEALRSILAEVKDRRQRQAELNEETAKAEEDRINQEEIGSALSTKGQSSSSQSRSRRDTRIGREMHV